MTSYVNQIFIFCIVFYQLLHFVLVKAQNQFKQVKQLTLDSSQDLADHEDELPESGDDHDFNESEKFIFANGSLIIFISIALVFSGFLVCIVIVCIRHLRRKKPTQIHPNPAGYVSPAVSPAFPMTPYPPQDVHPVFPRTGVIHIHGIDMNNQQYAMPYPATGYVPQVLPSGSQSTGYQYQPAFSRNHMMSDVDKNLQPPPYSALSSIKSDTSRQHQESNSILPSAPPAYTPT